MGQTRPVTVRKISANHNDLISKFEPTQRRTSLYERRTFQSSLLNGLSSATPSASTSGTSTPRHENVEKPYEIAEKLSVAGTALTAERRRSSVTGKPKILRTKAEVSFLIAQMMGIYSLLLLIIARRWFRLFWAIPFWFCLRVIRGS